MDLQTGRPNALLKSKSSNTRVKPRVEKKSKSSGEFNTLIVKKRGVYVEKRVTSPGTYSPEPEVVIPRIKAPPRSRPGAKRFLDSVLTILSKTTTGTQYPNRSHKMPKNRAKDDDELDLWLLEQNAAVKKPKHKKGEHGPKPKRDQRTEEERSRHTHHSKEKFKRKLARHVPEEVRSEGKIPIVDSEVANGLIKGNTMNLKKENQDPVTMVNTAAKDDKLYSLFVNLLETVYNKTDKDAPGIKSTKSFKINNKKDDLLKEQEPRRDVSTTDKLFMNSRFAKDRPQPFDSKWREHELEDNIEESTNEFEVDDDKPSQTNVFEEAVNIRRYSPRSKALTKEIYKELPQRVVTIKSNHELRNNVTSTTSKITNRSTEFVKWPDSLPKLVNSETGEVIKNDDTMDVENSIARTVMEGNRLNMEKKTDTTTTSGPEKDKKLYSLFVNLLESVYPDLQSPEHFDQSYKLQSQMKVNAARKHKDVIKQTNYSLPLCVKCKTREKRRPGDRKYDRSPYDTRWSYRDDESESPVRRVRKKVKHHVHKHESPEKRAPSNPRFLRKKNKKQELLAVIKQQLSQHDDSYKEPATFYDALRIMARNRRKEYNDANFIRRAQDVGDDSDNDSACRFRKRKAARNTRARPTRYPKSVNRTAPASTRFGNSYSEYKPPNYGGESIAPDSEDSYHSLAVYGYDYYSKPHSTKSSISSDEMVDYEVTYNWQSTVGSQCYNN